MTMTTSMVAEAKMMQTFWKQLVNKQQEKDTLLAKLYQRSSFIKKL